MKRAEWEALVEEVTPEFARGLQDDVVARLHAVKSVANQNRDFCAALLRDLQKPPIPGRVTKSFVQPLVDLSNFVRRLRRTLLPASVTHFFFDCLIL